MLDRERADFFRALDSLKEAFGPHVVATEIPIGAEHELRGLIDLVDMKAYEYDDDGALHGDPDPGRPRRPRAGVPREAHGRGRGELRGADGALPRGRGDLPRRDRHARSRTAPTTATSSRSPAAWPPRGWAPTACWTRSSTTCRPPSSTAASTSRRASRSSPTPSGEMFAYVFKTRADPFAGRINLFRVYQGTMTHDTQVMNTRTHHKERVGQLLVPRGKEVSHADTFGPGDIGAVAKLKETHAGDWLAARDQPIHMPRIKLPAPVMAFAMEPKNKGDEDKVYTALRRLQEEDPTIDLHRDEQTGEQIVAGLSQIHVEVIVDRMKQPLRRRGDAQAAARALPGDDPRLGQGPRAPQEADRRPRPVRRLPHRDRAARRRRLRVRQRDQGRRDPARLHPRGREGRARGDAERRRRRLPRQGRAGEAVRRLLPHGRLVRDGVQARRHASRMQEALSKAGAGAAGADHARDVLDPGRQRRRRHGRPVAHAAGARWAPRRWAA